MASTAIDQEWLERLCRRTDDILWRSYRFALGASDAPWPRVMFPVKGHERRVGEQEARFAFLAALLGDPASASWAFAAEAPTRLSYRFAQRGASPRAQRALTDLALYRGDGDAAALAVEFKSGGRLGRSEQDDSLRKDVAKILAEQPPALWFHVVREAATPRCRDCCARSTARSRCSPTRTSWAPTWRPARPPRRAPRRSLFTSVC